MIIEEPLWQEFQRLLPNAGITLQFPYVRERRVPAGIWKPATVQSSMASLGADRGAGGFIRNVSLIMACKYTKLFISDSCTCRCFPTWMSSSSWALFSTWRLFNRNDTVHVNTTTFASMPPKIRLCNQVSSE